MKRILIFTITVLCFLASCKKSDTTDIPIEDKGELTIEFDNVVGSDDLQLNGVTYMNASGESYTVTTFDYYISNITLMSSNGVGYTLPKDSSYFLIRESASTQAITLEGIPAADYKGISFIVGVDSMKSVSPASQRTGVLDPAGAGAGMSWASDPGYIFLKLEGTSQEVSTPNKKFSFHIGGIGGSSSANINNVKTVTLSAPSGMAAEVRKGKAEAPEIHLFADVAKILDGESHVSLAANPMVMLSLYSMNIANNYKSMFTISHIHND